MRTPMYFIVLEQFMKNKVSTFVWLDLTHKYDQDRGEDTKISQIFLGENPAFTIQYQNVYD